MTSITSKAFFSTSVFTTTTLQLRDLANKALKSNQLLKNNNVETFLININDLVRAEIQIPDEQRIVLPETVNQIEEYQETHFKKHKHFNFLGTLNINFCQEQNSYYLMDGQHRYSAIKRLHRKQYHNEKVKIELITVPTFTDVLHNYKLINKNTPLPEWSPNIDENIPKQVFASLMNEYPDIWKKSKKPKRPYINYNDFQEALSYLTEQLNALKQTAYTETNTSTPVSTSDTTGTNESSSSSPHLSPFQPVSAGYLKSLIVNKNNKMQNWTVESYKKIRNGVNWELYKKEADEHGFYLGMHLMTGQEYSYEWVKEIIQEETGHHLKKQKNMNPKTKKKRIPKQLRLQVWDTYIGEQHGTSYCYCCRNEKIDKGKPTWECGHIKAEAENGSIHLNNLRPICKSCNLSMGTEHMTEYIKKFYPDNLNAYQSKTSPGPYIIAEQTTSLPSSKTKKGFFGLF